MIISPEVAAAFGLKSGLEAYDNSTLDTIDSCVRKAYWKLIFPLSPDPYTRGIAEKVGVAAYVGTCIHRAMDCFYSPILYHSCSYEKRKLIAMKVFSEKYHELIPEYEMVPEPYTHPTCIRLLADYFDHYQNEDTFYVPVETELCIVVYITDLDPPCYFIVRMDGLILRVAMQDYLVREFKTTKSGVQNKIDELRISRQPKGYVWGARQPEFRRPNDNKPISGFMGDVIGIRVKQAEFARDIFHINDVKEQEWYRGTLIKIQRWREIKAKAGIAMNGDVSPLFQHHFWDQNTKQCLNMGKCSFYDLCYHGPTEVDLQKFLPNDWNPLYADKAIEVVP